MKANLAPLMSSEKMDWETPDSVFAPLNKEFQFNVDLAANSLNKKFKVWLGPGSEYAEDSLNVSWRHLYANCGTGHVNLRGWLNPPYGKELPLWVKKAYEETRNENTLVVMLIPARTDTRFWHEYVMKAEEIRFLKGRIKFVGAKASAPFPSAIVIFGKRGKEI